MDSDIAERLAEPFEPSEVKFKPAVVSGSRAMALAYVDARAVQDRLDNVFGVTGWQDDYEVLADGCVVCKLRCFIDGAWVQKTDVGSPSEQPDGGDRTKASFSDALKRAAVKFGVGRYLYRLPMQWVDYDPGKRQFRVAPALPESALPRKKAARTDGEGRERRAVLDVLKKAAMGGMKSLEGAWHHLTNPQRKLVADRLPALKEDAALMDREKEAANAPGK